MTTPSIELAIRKFFLASVLILISFFTIAQDVSVPRIESPVTDCNIGVDSISVLIFNLDSVPIANIPLVYKVNNGNLVTDTFRSTIPALDSKPFTFSTPYDFTQDTIYSIECYSELNNDVRRFNDTARMTIESVPTISWQNSNYVYKANFEKSNQGWTVGGIFPGVSWELGLPNDSIINSPSSGQYAWVTNLDGDYSNSEDSWLLSPCFNFAFALYPQISFDLIYDIKSRQDGLILEGTIDNGQSWIRIGFQGDTINWYNDTASSIRLGTNYQTGDAWTGDGSDNLAGSGGWQRAYHDLYGFAAQIDVRFRFRFMSDSTSSLGEGAGIDSIMIFTGYVGLDEYKSETVQYTISPNPSTGFFKLNIESQRPANMNLSIRDIDGKLVHEEIFSVNGRLNKSMDLSGLVKGIYFIQLQDKDQIKVEKLVIQ